MIEEIIDGTEKMDDEFLRVIKQLPSRLQLESIFKVNPEEAAGRFISLAMSADYLLDSPEYFKNMAALLFSLAKHERFYYELLQLVPAIDETIVPRKASLLLYGL